MGAVLSQKQLDGKVAPIAYASRTLQQHKKNYGTSELEALAVLLGCQTFKTYLYDHPCDVITDYEALKGLLNTTHLSGKLARWGLALQELDLKIHYQAGRLNSCADALSHVPLEVSGTDREGETMVATMRTFQVKATEIWQRDREQIHNWDQLYIISGMAEA